MRKVFQCKDDIMGARPEGIIDYIFHKTNQLLITTVTAPAVTPGRNNIDLFPTGHAIMDSDMYEDALRVCGYLYLLLKDPCNIPHALSTSNPVIIKVWFLSDNLAGLIWISLFWWLITKRHGCQTYREKLMARFMGPTWGPSGATRTQVGPILAPWTLLSGLTVFLPWRLWEFLSHL